jgi:hypothetical protein
MYRQLVKEAAGKDTELERRLEIKKQLTAIRRERRKLKQEGMCGRGDTKLSPLEYVTKRLKVGVLSLL